MFGYEVHAYVYCVNYVITLENCGLQFSTFVLQIKLFKVLPLKFNNY